MSELLIIAFIVIGAAIGRWWAALIAVPVGVWFTYAIPFDNPSSPHWYVGLLATAFAAALLIAGVLLRRILSPPGKTKPE